MPLMIKQIEMLTPGQTLTTFCPTPGKWESTKRTAYNGRKRLLSAQEDKTCTISQDVIARTVSVSVELNTESETI
jgi:hypothetical protein